MKAHAKTTALAADSSKYGRAGFASVLPLSAMDLILTDNELTDNAEYELRETGIEIRRVEIEK